MYLQIAFLLALLYIIENFFLPCIDAHKAIQRFKPPTNASVPHRLALSNTPAPDMYLTGRLEAEHILGESHYICSYLIVI
jgi:hypothetical protein